MSDSVRPHRRQPTRLPCPWDSPGKNTGVGCHFLLQFMKVKSESETAQSCLTLRNPVDCSPPGSSVHGIFQARALEWGATVFSEWNYYKKLITYEDSTIFPLESTVVKSCKHAFIKAVPTLISTWSCEMKSISSLIDRQKTVTWGSVKTVVIIRQEFHIVRKLMKSDFLRLHLTSDWRVH